MPKQDDGTFLGYADFKTDDSGAITLFNYSGLLDVNAAALMDDRYFTLQLTDKNGNQAFSPLALVIAKCNTAFVFIKNRSGTTTLANDFDIFFLDQTTPAPVPVVKNLKGYFAVLHGYA